MYIRGANKWSCGLPKVVPLTGFIEELRLVLQAVRKDHKVQFYCTSVP